MDQVAPGWHLNRSAEEWKASADAVGTFRTEQGRWPKITAKDAGERRLGLWLSTQRRRAANGTARFTEEHQAYLDHAAPGWAS